MNSDGSSSNDAIFEEEVLADEELESDTAALI